MNKTLFVFLVVLFCVSSKANSSCISQELRTGFEGFASDNLSDIIIEGYRHEATFSGGTISESDVAGNIFEEAWYLASSGDSTTGLGYVVLQPNGLFVEFDYMTEGDIQANIQLLDKGLNVIYERMTKGEQDRFSYNVLDGDASIDRLNISIVGGSGGLYVDNFYYFGDPHLEPCNDVVSIQSGGSMGALMLCFLLLLVIRNYNLTKSCSGSWALNGSACDIFFT